MVNNKIIVCWYLPGRSWDIGYVPICKRGTMVAGRIYRFLVHLGEQLGVPPNTGISMPNVHLLTLEVAEGGCHGGLQSELEHPFVSESTVIFRIIPEIDRRIITAPFKEMRNRCERFPRATRTPKWPVWANSRFLLRDSISPVCLHTAFRKI